MINYVKKEINREFAFEYLSAKFAAYAAKIICRQLKGVVLASPLSARSTDICMLWHPSYLKKHRLRLIFGIFISLLKNFFRGTIKIFLNLVPYHYAIYGKIKDSLLVVPSHCARKAYDGRFISDYVRIAPDEAVFIFGNKGTSGEEEKSVRAISFVLKLYFLYKLLICGTVAFFKTKGNRVNLFLIYLHWISWSLSLEWLSDYSLENNLSEIVSAFYLKKIGCIHEMHAYSRIVWSVAHKHRINGFTVQHASIAAGKRWYFAYPEEISSGLKLPSIMYVYNSQVRRDLEPYFPETVFRLGCSSRYAHWKKAPNTNYPRTFYLFVGALPKFDNNALLITLRNIIAGSNKSAALRLRLHPRALLTNADRHWLNHTIKKGLVELSTGSGLWDDLTRAIAVIGVGSTTLGEALILGRPTVQLTHPDYLKYIDIKGIKGATVKDYRYFSFKDMLALRHIEVDTKAACEKLGLFETEVTYERLFS